ncbi:hypothetical protein [Nocardia sp. IFM 10818]
MSLRADGGYLDLFPGHRVVLISDGHGGYEGPAYFVCVPLGAAITLEQWLPKLR